MSYKLLLGNKTYSSWSLRGWLLFRAFKLACEEEIFPLRTETFNRLREAYAPARQVPTLIVGRDSGDLTIWDSVAIAEYLHETHPDAGIWPSNIAARAAARSLCAEMHAGFGALRQTMPMNLRRRYASFKPDADTEADINRMCQLWRWAQQRWGGDGPFLFGSAFTAADAFFAPVATRFRTYGISLDTPSQAYVNALLSHPAVVDFYTDAATESWVLEHCEMDID